MLLIEHDVRMVTGLSDYMYVIDRGNKIAEGPPDKVQRDEAVIAAYLGTEADDADSHAKAKPSNARGRKKKRSPDREPAGAAR